MPVRKRGGVYWVSVSFRGQRVRTSAGKGATKEQALELEAKIRSDFHANRVGRKPDRLISEALLKWLDGECKRLKSAVKFESHARALLPYVQGKTLSQAHQVSDEIKKTMPDKVSVITTNRRLAILRRVLNLAYREWRWLDSPISLSLLRENSERHVYLTPKEVQKLAKACTDKNAATMIWLAASTGLRRGELLRLTADNLRDGCIVLDSQTKSGRPRVVPVPVGLKVKLPIVISNNKLRRQFEAARDKIGKPEVRFHDLRHTYASWLVQAGAPLGAVRDLLGHTSLSVTSRYAHLAPTHLRDAVKRISRHIPGTAKRRKKANVS